MDELMGFFLSHESRVNLNKNSSFENIFRAQTLSRGRGRHGQVNIDQGRRTNQPDQSFNNRGHGRNKQSSRFDKSNIQCYQCERYGHFATECRKKQENLETLGANYPNVSNGNSGNLFIICNMAQESSKDVWFLDSGCSNHMSRKKRIIFKFK